MDRPEEMPAIIHLADGSYKVSLSGHEAFGATIAEALAALRVTTSQQSAQKPDEVDAPQVAAVKLDFTTLPAGDLTPGSPGIPNP